MARKLRQPVGRANELAAVLKPPAGPQGVVRMLTGPPGSGRTTLLEHAVRTWRTRGTVVLTAVHDGGPGFDLLDGLLRDARFHAARFHAARFQAAPSRARALDRVPALLRRGAAAERNLLPMAHEVRRAIDDLARHCSVALVLRDLDDAAPDLVSALAQLFIGSRRAGVTVVASCGDDADILDDLAEVIDSTITLPDLPEHDIGRLITRWAAGRPSADQGLVNALRQSLGPLFGIPGAVVAVLDEARDAGRLATIDQHLCLIEPALPLALPVGHPFVVEAVHRHGRVGRRLSTAVAVLGPLRFRELREVATATQTRTSDDGAAVDRLLKDRVLAVDSVGRLHPRVPALGAALATLPGPRWVDGVRVRLARSLLDAARRDERVDSADLADVLMSLPPGASERGELNRLAAEPLDDNRLSAIRRAMTHDAAPGRPGWSDQLVQAMRSLAAQGEFDALAADMATVVLPAARLIPRPALAEITVYAVAAGLCRVRPRDMAVSLAMATKLHPADDLRDALRRGAFGDIAKRLTELFDSEPPPAAARVLDALWLLDRADSGAPDNPDLADAVSDADYATALSAAGFPDVGGPTRAYSRLLGLLRDGDWCDALAVARAIEATTATGAVTRLHHRVRAFAAETLSEMGEHRRAEAWADLVPKDGDDLLAEWVRCGLLCREGHADEAVAAGWRGWARHRRFRPGAIRLLGRISECALDCGDLDSARRAITELAGLHRLTGSVLAKEILSLAEGRLRRDPELVSVGLDLATRRGDRFAQVGACASMAAVADDPGDWLRTAYRKAKAIGADSTRRRLAQRMRERGLALPRARTGKAALSEAEFRMVQLVADGLTNRQIAAALVMSEKTVEGQLGKLFDRTGCRTRVDLAAGLLHGRITVRGGLRASRRTREG